MKDKKGIIYLLHNYYTQDVWDDHTTHTHEEVWVDLYEHDKSTVEPLKRDVEEMSVWTDKEILDFIYMEEGGGLRLDTPEEARAWLEKLDKFLEENKN